MRIMRRVLWIGIAFILVVGGTYGIYRYSTRPLPGASYPSVGQEHIGLDAVLPRPYNSNPPSSGAHYSQPANWGIYDYEVNDRIFIHNLEHGGIWVSYRPSVPPATVEKLKAIVSSFSGSKLVMAPRSANDADIAVVAWARVLKFDLDGDNLTAEQESRIKAFYRAFKNHGPEFVPDTMPGIDPKNAQ